MKHMICAPSGIDKSTFLESIDAVQYDYPELFYVDFHKVKYEVQGGEYRYEPLYRYTLERIEKINKLLELEVAKFLDYFRKSNITSIYSKCGWIHNYLVTICSYDYSATKNPEMRSNAYTIEGPLLDHRAVCQGVSLAFCYLCKKVCVTSIVIKGVSLQPENLVYEKHAWNMVIARESAAHIDVTWDMCLTDSYLHVRYDYFFLSDKDMIKDHQYVGYPICNRKGCAYYERKGLQFQDVDQLKEYVKKRILLMQKNDNSLYLVYKMNNCKMALKVFLDAVINTVSEETRRAFTITSSINEKQSVICNRISFE